MLRRNSFEQILIVTHPTASVHNGGQEQFIARGRIPHLSYCRASGWGIEPRSEEARRSAGEKWGIGAPKVTSPGARKCNIQ